MGHNATREQETGRKKTLTYVILIFQIVLIGSLIKGIQTSYKSKDRIKLLEEKREELQSENTKLKHDVEYVQSDYYVEKIAREELQRAKIGEQVVILPDGSTQFAVRSSQEKISNEKQLKNWEKWWKLVIE